MTNLLICLKKNFWILACPVALLYACTPNQKDTSVKNASPYFTNFFIEKEKEVLRGVNFNVTAEELKNLEKSKLYDATTDHLFYEFTYPKDSTSFSEYTNIQYFFNENNRLDIITLAIYLNDSLQVNSLKNTLNEYFNLRFGNPEINETGHSIWNGDFEDKLENKNYNYTVELKNITGDYGLSVEYVLQ